MTREEKERAVSFAVDRFINELGYKCWDFSNQGENENNKKIEEVKRLILELSETLPKA